MSMVRHKQGELPPLTAERVAELQALADAPDSTIDYSDIPPAGDVLDAKAVSSPFYKPVKTHVSMRIDADVLAWLKAQGKYQTKANEILRNAMIQSLHNKETTL